MASHKYLYKFLGCSSRQPHFESSRMWFIFKLQLVTNVLQGEDEDDSDNNEERNNSDATDSENVALKKAFKKWQDHRPSFAEMHSEDVKRRPRWSLMWSGISKSHEKDFLLIFHDLVKKLDDFTFYTFSFSAWMFTNAQTQTTLTSKPSRWRKKQ